jgi:hypothetical protein
MRSNTKERCENEVQLDMEERIAYFSKYYKNMVFKWVKHLF